uniref:Putative ovule protein n=1 Tax=Solanum chacoense TaxID=4108 RepID=A0A0V0I5C4_SOLCH
MLNPPQLIFWLFMLCSTITCHIIFMVRFIITCTYKKIFNFDNQHISIYSTHTYTQGVSQVS